MDGQDRENLKELLEKFFGAEQAARCMEDFREAERILREHPAPEPDDMLIANIKAQIAMRLPARRAQRFRRRVWEAVGAAAAIAVLALVSVRLPDEARRQPGNGAYASLIPAALWESANIAADDADLAVFTTQIEQIRDEVLTLESGRDAGDSDSSIAELEMELIQISSDFWKG
jgi:hypothetical protein